MYLFIFGARFLCRSCHVEAKASMIEFTIELMFVDSRDSSVVDNPKAKSQQPFFHLDLVFFDDAQIQITHP
jgi:hypothetical protein